MDGVKNIPGVHPYEGHKQNPQHKKHRSDDERQDEKQREESKQSPRERAHNVIPTSLIASSLPIYDEMTGEALEPPLHEPKANAVHHYQEAVRPAEVKHAPPASQDEHQEYYGGRDENLTLEQMLERLATLESIRNRVDPGDKSLGMLFEQMENARDMARHSVHDVNEKMLHLAVEKAATYLGEMAELLGALERMAADRGKVHIYIDMLDKVLDQFIVEAHRVQAILVKASLDAPDVFPLRSTEPIEQAVSMVPHIREQAVSSV